MAKHRRCKTIDVKDGPRRNIGKLLSFDLAAVENDKMCRKATSNGYHNSSPAQAFVGYLEASQMEYFDAYYVMKQLL